MTDMKVGDIVEWVPLCGGIHRGTVNRFQSGRVYITVRGDNNRGRIVESEVYFDANELDRLRVVEVSPVSPTLVQAALDVAATVYKVIAKCGPSGIPSGHLYAQLMGEMSLETYKSLIGLLVRSGLVEESNHLLVAVAK